MVDYMLSVERVLPHRLLLDFWQPSIAEYLLIHICIKLHLTAFTISYRVRMADILQELDTIVVQERDRFMEPIWRRI
jgi:hypothetical protein